MSGVPKRILVVDDDPDIRDNLAESLRASGYQVELAANGVEAIQAILRSRPDAMLLDMMMPVMDGASVMRAIAGAKDIGSIPTLALTAWPEKAAAVGLEVAPKDDVRALLARVHTITNITVNINGRRRMNFVRSRFVHWALFAVGVGLAVWELYATGTPITLGAVLAAAASQWNRMFPPKDASGTTP